MQEIAVAIVDDTDLSATDKLAASLDRAGFWTVVANAAAERGAGACRVVIKPELSGYAIGSPTVTDPAFVEYVIDLLHDRGFIDVSIVGTTDSSSLWAENRDLIALSDLLGYRFVTPRGRSYDIVDLAEDIDSAIFPVDSVLHGCGLSRSWYEAEVRIVFTKCRTDEAAGYALCLDTLIGVLPLADKNLHYRQRRHPGDVVTALLSVAPVDFCLIDAIVSAHGADGRRAPRAIDTNTIVAAPDIILADTVGAQKMGVDPAVSPIYARVLTTHPLPRRYTVAGSLGVYYGWLNVPMLSMHATRARGSAEALDRMIAPWLQQVDPALFPLKHPLDARLNGLLAGFFADTDAKAVSQWMLLAANVLVAYIGQALQSYRTLFDKDALRQQSVSLGIDISSISEDAFDELVGELRQIERIAHDAPRASDELRWRYLDEAVVFSYSRTLPIDHGVFVQRVDIARTIGFMNDYLGGVVVPLVRDAVGRPVRQAERNIYLPQPNYLVLYDGKPIDVSKLEVVEYGSDCHRLYWKTVLSDNGSARYDDGIASFVRQPGGTQVTIVGRQQFTLPAFWRIFDLNRIPDLKSMLVTHAYRTFFDRTITNFEAMIEGRDIRIGRPVDEPAMPPVELIMPLLTRIGEIAMPLLQGITSNRDAASARDTRGVDADGFIHVTPVQSTVRDEVSEPERWSLEIMRFLSGLGDALQRDLAQSGHSA